MTGWSALFAAFARNHLKADTMNITMPPSDTARNVEAIKRAIDSKAREVSKTSRELDDLRAELRGLQSALKVISPDSN